MKNTKATPDSEAPAEPVEAADFEMAASLTGFGMYNYLLFFISVVCSLANQFSSSSMSYLLPAAQCDLQMQPSDKGLLNSIMYAGMLLSSFLWGFLSDMLGRRKLIVVAYAVDGVLNLIGSFTQSFAFLVVIKFMTGVVLSGPMAIRLTFISEFHSLKYRTRIMVLSGFLYAIATIIIPAVAWLIIPLPWSVTFFDGYITYNSWRMFVTVGALSSFLAAFLIYLCPEAPKFLMTKGRSEEALQAFKTVYKHNTGKEPETYPVKKLKEEVQAVPDPLTTNESRKSACSLLRFALKDAKLLLLKPLRNRTIMIMILNYGALLSSNTIRHWVPQMFASAEEYKEYQKYTNTTNASVSICEMISFTGVADTDANAGSCGVAMVRNTVYINNIIVASSQGLSFLLTTYIIKYIGKKMTMVIGYVGAAICSMAAYWTYSTSTALACFALIVSLTGVSNIACLAVIVDMFPTGVRSMAMGLNSMTGQFGTFTGNLAFPYLLAIDCVAPFSLITILTLVGAGVTLLLPDTDKASLQ
ncbi:synaptic vesicle glycoprotein 2B-like [Schistocerca americana]|uniref:synaptic vesicle glycoprotein 2B-like n=1 Tax=Schistocerca americana TaxID=7009 RepID=UPI001F4F7B7F|nr:synaptic vesicle glycoprotein 2B-like [Schistocerca americana]XP_049964701.1 synaptic vesicle glycoprotein 2B-like [Schistocerca serialis cubense]